VRRFLATPVGWVALLFVEGAVLLLVADVLLRISPGGSTTTAWVVLGLAAVLAFVNYTLRRRYLR
jgi:hypothetical protein